MTLEAGALAAYAVLFIAFSFAIGRFLRLHGSVFLSHTFQQNPPVAKAVQRLLDLGFYLLCLALLLWNIGLTPSGGYQSDPDNPGAMISLFDVGAAFQSVALRLGISIFVVAAFHSLNVLVLSVLSRKAAPDTNG